MKDQSVKEEFLKLRAKGWSFNRIAKQLGVSKPTLLAWSRDFALEIRNQKALEHENLPANRELCSSDYSSS
jgi:transcriptional regulator with XRE-family HTH domain